MKTRIALLLNGLLIAFTFSCLLVRITSLEIKVVDQHTQITVLRADDLKQQER